MAVERRSDLLGDDDPCPVLRLLSRRTQVRGHDHVVELEQRAGVRLLREDVECCACDLSRPERLGQSILVDELPASSVHDPDAVTGSIEPGPVDEASCLLRQ